jgi:ATP-dependent RNA helicase RhlE
MSFTTFGLSDHVLKGVEAAGYTTPTPIQSLALGPAVEGRDIIGRAQTGTGKTAAFVLPILHRLAENTTEARRDRFVRSLIVTPTRELAQQVHDSVVTYGKFLSFRAVVVYGGVSMENQVKLLRRGADIIIATPGRLLDHMNRGSISLSRVQILVLDEADRMLDMGFINDMRAIIAAVPKERQTMLFSATISDDIKRLASDILRNPHTVEAGEQRNPAETITQYFYSCTPHTKMDLLVHALEKENMNSALVFSRTKHGADKISRRLERKGIKAATIHSNRTQSQRQRALDGFKDGTYSVLVATDIAARGIDVDGISHVINFDIPQYAEDYIHRIGRTGRAGSSGDAITFVAREDQQYLRGIERFTGKKFLVKPYDGFVPPPAPEGQPVREHASGHSAPHQRRSHPVRNTHGGPAGQGTHGAPTGYNAHGSSTGRNARTTPAGRSASGTSAGRTPHGAPTGYKRPARPHAPGAVQKHAGAGAPAGFSPYKKKNDRRGPSNTRGSKRKPFEFGRKRKPAGKLDAFSSDGGGGWSNH